MAQLSVAVDRHKYFGGSDVAIAMNLSPYKTRWQLLQEKAQIVENTFEGNAYTEYGNIMEGKIRAFVNISMKHEFVEGKHYMKFEDADVRIHTDGEDKKKCEVLEVKTTSQVHSDVMGYKHYLVQLLFYMMMLNYPHGKLAVYERPSDFSEHFDPERLQIFEVELADFTDLVSEIEKAVQLFMIDLQKLRDNPFLTQADLLSDDESTLAMRLVSLKEQEGQIKAISAEIKGVEEKLQEVMAKNGRKTFDGFGYKITLVAATAGKETESIDFDFNRFRKEQPVLFAEYCKEIKTVKKGGRSAYLKLTKTDD